MIPIEQVAYRDRKSSGVSLHHSPNEQMPVVQVDFDSPLVLVGSREVLRLQWIQIAGDRR